MTKIHVVSGFLGAGKTTLIKKLLSEALKGQKVVLIENEFGEIAVDGGFLKDAGVEITEMNSGCICCSLVGDFTKALHEVIERYQPDQILIEPSGVGKLSDVLRAVQDMPEDAVLGGSVTVADATKCKLYISNFGEFFLNQIQYVSTIVLSRTQKMTQEKLEQCIALLRKTNEKAAIITTPWDELGGDKIMAVIEKEDSLERALLAEQEKENDEECDDEECECHHHHHDGDEGEEHEHHHHHHDGDEEEEHEHHHHHHDDDEEEHEHHHHHHHHHHHGHDADEVFESWGCETVKKYSKEDILAILGQLGDAEKYGIVLRAKGILPTPEGDWLQFDYVPDEPSVRMGSADYTGRLCVIGSKLHEDCLEMLFKL